MIAIVVIVAPASAGMSAMKFAVAGIAPIALVGAVAAGVSVLAWEHAASALTAMIAPAPRTSSCEGVTIDLSLMRDSIRVAGPPERGPESLVPSRVGVAGGGARYTDLAVLLGGNNDGQPGPGCVATSSSLRQPAVTRDG